MSFVLSVCVSPAWRHWRCAAPPTACAVCAVCRSAVRCFGNRISASSAAGQRKRERDRVLDLSDSRIMCVC